MPRPFVVVAVCVMTMAALGPAARAEVVGEGVVMVRCAEGTDLTLPKKMSLVQILSADRFADYDQVALLLEGEVAEREVNRGKVIATVFQVADDGSETKLGKVTMKFAESEGNAHKIIDAALAPGDELLWKLRLKGMPALSGAVDDCFSAIFTVAVAEETEP